MQHKTVVKGDEAELHISGRLTYADAPEFERLIGGLLETDLPAYVLHLGELEYIDSFGLGLLVLFYDKAVESRSKLSIKGATGMVRKLLDHAQFHIIMPIVD